MIQRQNQAAGWRKIVENSLASTTCIIILRIQKVDIMIDSKTSKRMSAIRSKNSMIELLLRKRLHALGFRYRVHHPDIIGKPDVVFTKKKVAIFIDSHFWHGYNFEDLKRKKFKNKDYWIKKIKKNMDRDYSVSKILKDQGWTVLRFWEHELKDDIDTCVENIVHCIQERKND